MLAIQRNGMQLQLELLPTSSKASYGSKVGSAISFLKALNILRWSTISQSICYTGTFIVAFKFGVSGRQEEKVLSDRKDGGLLSRKLEVCMGCSSVFST